MDRDLEVSTEPAASTTLAGEGHYDGEKVRSLPTAPYQSALVAWTAFPNQASISGFTDLADRIDRALLPQRLLVDRLYHEALQAYSDLPFTSGEGQQEPPSGRRREGEEEEQQQLRRSSWWGRKELVKQKL